MDYFLSIRRLDMSDIYGFVAQKSISDPAMILKRMFEIIPSPEPLIIHHWIAKKGNAGFGTIHPARIVGSRHFAEDVSNGVLCVFDGIIYRDINAHEDTLVESNGAAVLLEQYLKSGIECLTKINGSFNVAWWSERTRSLVLANDKFGQRPLFWGIRNGTLVFASMFARIMATGILSSEIDVEGFADLLSYEYILGEKTLFKDVHTLPPASYLTYKGNKISIQQYWRLDHVEPRGKYDKRRLDELENIFKIAVKRSIRPDITCAIPLTGGLDSRCILAAAINQKLPFITYTMGQPDSTDVIIAQKIAHQIGVQHIFELISPDILSDWLVPMVLHQGGTIATLHSHPCRALYSSPPFDALIPGIGSDPARRFWISPAELNIQDLTTAQKLLRRKLLGKKKPQYLDRLWRPEFKTIGLHTTKEHIHNILLGYNSKDSLATRMDYFFLHERNRKFLNKAILIVRPIMDVYLPYFDHQWIKAIVSIPISERITNRIQVDLIKRLCPEILDFPYAKNLLPLSTPLWKTDMVKYYREMKRRAYQKLGFVYHGYTEVPITYYSRWSREKMRSTLVELLYKPNAAFRAYLQWETVEALLNQHFSGEEDWEPLVAALTVFEISHKLWVTP